MGVKFMVRIAPHELTEQSAHLRGGGGGGRGGLVRPSSPNRVSHPKNISPAVKRASLSRIALANEMSELMLFTEYVI